MSQDRMTDLQDERAAQLQVEETPEVEADQGPVVSPAMASSMLSGPMSGVQRRSLVESVGQNFGNKQVQRMLGTVRRSASAGADGGPLEGDLAQTIQSERSKGQPLDAGVRREIEPSLGADLSQVRVHTGPLAESLNQDMGAKAFTTGRDIFYGAGTSPSDKELTAHEATHAVQQGMSETAPTEIGAANTAHEQAAEHTAANLGGAVGVGVQREAADEEELQMSRIERAEADEEELQMSRVEREMPEEEELQA